MPKITTISGLSFGRLPKAVFVIILTLFTFNIQAQQLRDLVVNEIENPFNTIPVFIDYPDDAAIIVTSSLTNLRFDSNFEVVDDKSDAAAGEYRIIVRPFRQTITVQANGYKQLRFTVPVSQAREVRFFTIEPMEEEVDLIPTVFAISPAQAMDASVFIDGQAVDINRAVELTPGSHELRIEKQGYRTISETIIISDDQTAIRRYEMEQLEPQTITITSTPTDAIIEINNVVRGNTDRQLFEFPGDYFVRISKAGYKSIQQTISVVENESNTFNFVLEEFGGDLNLSITPANARVSLNGQPVALTNGTARVIPGTYTLSVDANGYRSYSEPLIINENDVITRTINLEQIIGSLQFSIQPIFADVILQDGFGNTVQQWQGARFIPSLPTGNYTLRASADQHELYTTSIVIRENQTTTFDAQMTSFSEAEIAERERQAQLERDRQALAAAREEQRRKDAAKDRRQSFFKRPAFGGLYLHYNAFEIDGNAFSTNVDESYGLGLGFFKYKNLKTTSLDFVYNSYTMINSSSLPDEIISYNIAASFVPTLPLGPFMIGYGVGVDFTQYEDADDLAYYYTYDAFLSFQLTFKPKSWGIGFMMDSRNSWDIGLADVYNPWSQVKYSLILSF